MRASLGAAGNETLTQYPSAQPSLRGWQIRSARLPRAQYHKRGVELDLPPNSGVTCPHRLLAACDADRTMANIPTGLASTAHRLLPILNWLPAYRRDCLTPDFLAGIALWAVMVPESMAYSDIVGVPPIMGLYTIVPALLAYTVFGTSRQLVV